MYFYLLNLLNSTRLRAPFCRPQKYEALLIQDNENVTLKWIRVFSTYVGFFHFAENEKCRRISLELISWESHSHLERAVIVVAYPFQNMSEGIQKQRVLRVNQEGTIYPFCLLFIGLFAFIHDKYIKFSLKKKPIVEALFMGTF